MKIKSLAAIAAFAAAVLAANAQGVATGIGDLVLGFMPGTGSTNVEVKLGNISSFSGVGPGTYNLGNYNSVLSTAFGGSWASDSGLQWGVVGNIGLVPQGSIAARTAWVSSAWSTTSAGTLGLQNSAAYGASSTSALNTTNTRVNGVYTSMTNAANTQPNTVVGNAVINAAGNWANNSSFNFDPSNFTNLVTNLAVGQTYSAADLYTMKSGVAPTGILGTFAVFQNGDVTFTVIPEPSTYAAILGVATLGFAAIRRRKQQVAQV